ncbi:hypothetical protein AAC387_Pa02g2999 [Persea americana]
MATSSSNTFVLTNVSHLVPIKLDQGNYLLWKSLFLPILRGHDLMGYIDGSSACPPQYSLDDSGKHSTTVNPLYKEWIIKDQDLLTWLNSMLSEMSSLMLLYYILQRQFGMPLSKGMPFYPARISYNLRNNFKLQRKGHPPCKITNNRLSIWRTNSLPVQPLSVKMISSFTS